MKYAICSVTMIYRNGQFLMATVTHEFSGGIDILRCFGVNDYDTAFTMFSQLAKREKVSFKNIHNNDMYACTCTYYKFMGWK